MPEYRFNLEPNNPGQFLACCGMFELADLLAPGVEARFENGGTGFIVEAKAPLPPWDLRLAPAEDLSGLPYDFTIEPLDLLVGSRTFRLSWWLNETLTDKSPFKTWGGQQRPRRVFEELLGSLDFSLSPDQSFEQAAYMTTRLGLDARSAWDALDLGYSPNDETSTAAKQAMTYPWIEVLAAVGLEGFRPATGQKRGRFRYAVWFSRLPVPVARAASAGALPDGPRRCFEFAIATRGQGYKTFLFGEGD